MTSFAHLNHRQSIYSWLFLTFMRNVISPHIVHELLLCDATKWQTIRSSLKQLQMSDGKLLGLII